MNWKGIFKWVAAGLLLWLIVWAVITFSASEEKQMLKQQQRFLTAVENRKWSQIDSMICKDYDDGALNAEQVKTTLRQVLGGFFTLSITPEITRVQVVHGLGFVKTKLKVEGNGAGLSSEVIAQANRIKSPWTFHWHKRGMWPWSWELVQVHNDELVVPDGGIESLSGDEK